MARGHRKAWPSAYSAGKEEHRVGQTQINIPKTKSPYTVEGLVSILPEFSYAYKVKYLFTHKLFFLNKKGFKKIHM